MPIDPNEIERRFRNQLDVGVGLANTLEHIVIDAVDPIMLMRIGREALKRLSERGMTISDFADIAEPFAPTLWPHAQTRADVEFIIENNLSELRTGLVAGPEPQVVSWARIERKHITQHMRQAHISELPETLTRIGQLIDETLLRTCNIIDLWQDIADIEVRRKARAYRTRVQQEREAQRQRRLEERRQAEASLTVSGNETQTPPVQHEKTVKHEVVRCAKCHKRPPTHGSLCEPCFTWERNKLGRT